jgi:hypothetical protein
MQQPGPKIPENKGKASLLLSSDHPFSGGAELDKLSLVPEREKSLIVIYTALFAYSE